jgi:ATP-dependent DNA helicase RecQ
VPSWDGTVAAQKALSAIYRTGQRFGAHHLIDILLGKETERVLRLQHNRLRTFGVGIELDRRGWHSVFRQLVAQGIVLPDLAGHGGLSLAPVAAGILRGAQTVRFRRDARSPKRHSAEPGSKGATANELEPEARAIWESLRTWRLEEARRQELPPYVIFHDATLIEVARRRPVSLISLATIPGVGASKLDRYGSAIIEIVSQSRRNPALRRAGLRAAPARLDQPDHAPRPAGLQTELIRVVLRNCGLTW